MPKKKKEQAPPSVSEWKYILYTMDLYHRTSGWIACINNKWIFFDSEPSTGGVKVSHREVSDYCKAKKPS